MGKKAKSNTAGTAAQPLNSLTAGPIAKLRKLDSHVRARSARYVPAGDLLDEALRLIGEGEPFDDDIGWLADDNRAMNVATAVLVGHSLFTDNRIPYTTELVRGMPRPSAGTCVTSDAYDVWATPHPRFPIREERQLMHIGVREYVLLLGAAWVSHAIGMSDMCRKLCDELEFHLNDLEGEWETEIGDLNTALELEASDDLGIDSWSPRGLAEKGALRAILCCLAIKSNRRLYRNAASGKPVEFLGRPRMQDCSKLHLRLVRWSTMQAAARPEVATGYLNMGWCSVESQQWRKATSSYQRAADKAENVEKDDLNSGHAAVQLAGCLVMGGAGPAVHLGQVRDLHERALGCMARLEKWGMAYTVKGESTYLDVLEQWLRRNKNLPGSAVLEAEEPVTHAGGRRERGGKNPMRYCAACGNPEMKKKLLQCAACARVLYCGRECQKAHWKAGHKGQCRPAAARDVGA